ncbi:MAG: single-stranded-DNA-specific exonuclease RecJ [Desulfobacteraceae bacterium]|nr:MAG: single-stranded-DNA-specific exonuclease RecJ [Desulfobacteraceae bacterium]
MSGGLARRAVGIWKLKTASPEAGKLAGDSGLSLLEAQVLINRGIRDDRSVRTFLTPRLSSLLDPMILKDMDRAVASVLKCLEEQEQITVFGDYDADGLTATALLVHLFTRLGVPVFYYIPNRLTEGYGLNPVAARQLAEKRRGLLITVDCGISNQEEIGLLQDLGMKVIVTDHHQVPEGFEPNCPVVNPHRTDCPFPFKVLSGVGLAFFLAVALRSALREKGWFRSRPEPDLREYLDLVALGTVADMAPLLDQNRILVKSGLERMSKSSWPGMKALGEISETGSSFSMNTEDLSFRLAPRLNACGRMGDAETGIRALLSMNMIEARNLCATLNSFNIRRQSMEKSILQEIEQSIPREIDPERRTTLVFAGKGWHKGVLGIVASKLAETFCRPAIVLDITDGVARGSARSIPGFDLFRAISSLKPLLRRFGGHPYAAGLSLDSSRIEEFSIAFERTARESIAPADLVPSIDVDGCAEFTDLDLRSVERLRSFGPFGSGNPEPVFCTNDVQIIDARTVGERHLRVRLKKGSIGVEGIGFGMAGRIPSGCREINIVYTPIVSRWQGIKKVELKLLDLEAAGGNSKLRITPCP